MKKTTKTVDGAVGDDAGTNTGTAGNAKKTGTVSPLIDLLGTDSRRGTKKQKKNFFVVQKNYM